jgi:hypothetical protein
VFVFARHVRVAAVHEQQARQKAKLRDRVVGRVARLQTLLARQPDADMRRLEMGADVETRSERWTKE